VDDILGDQGASVQWSAVHGAVRAINDVMPDVAMDQQIINPFYVAPATPCDT
jgi:hypothetical protein